MHWIVKGKFQWSIIYYRATKITEFVLGWYIYKFESIQIQNSLILYWLVFKNLVFRFPIVLRRCLRRSSRRWSRFTFRWFNSIRSLATSTTFNSWLKSSSSGWSSQQNLSSNNNKDQNNNSSNLKILFSIKFINWSFLQSTIFTESNLNILIFWKVFSRNFKKIFWWLNNEFVLWNEINTNCLKLLCLRLMSRKTLWNIYGC